MIFESKSVSETYKIADKILNKIKPGSVIALLGDLGAGKTTFTQGFAKRQSRLLGGAVRTCQSSHELNTRLKQLLEDPSLRLKMGQRGRQRMGPAGGGEAIAKRVLIQLPLGHGY